MEERHFNKKEMMEIEEIRKVQKSDKDEDTKKSEANC
jgi:hypothetical protein